jgi:hypothetical protein
VRDTKRYRANTGLSRKRPAPVLVTAQELKLTKKRNKGVEAAEGVAVGGVKAAGKEVMIHWDRVGRIGSCPGPPSPGRTGSSEGVVRELGL